jgi:RNA polymerase sigma-70 factor (ECF subfamily)
LFSEKSVTDADNIFPGRSADEPPTISSGLLKAVVANDRDAWMRLSAKFGPLVYYWCRVRGLQTSDAEDVVQEVFQALVRRIGDFRRDRTGSTFRGWLKTITCHKVGDFIRKCRGEQAAVRAGDASAHAAADEATDENAVESAEETSVETQLLYQRVLALIRGEFDERSWEAFRRVVVDEAAPKDVAAELDMTVNSVYLAKSRILRRVRDEFQEMLE